MVQSWNMSWNLEIIPHCETVLETILLVLTKVGYLGILVGIQQDILRLQVSVDYHVSVAVVYSRNNLLEKTASFCVLHLKDMT